MLGGAGGPPIMFDNIEQIRANYEKSLAEYQADRTKALNTLTTVSFFGGLGLVLLVAMLGLLRIVSGMHLWVSAIGATTCCLIIGAILMDPGRLTPGHDVAVAFLSYHAPRADSAENGAEASEVGRRRPESNSWTLTPSEAFGWTDRRDRPLTGTAARISFGTVAAEDLR